jgi:soluble lytic murein transglycosylase-like protein
VRPAVRRRAAVALAVFTLAVGAVGAEELLYYVKDGQIVFTNTPSRKDMKPVPRLRGGPAQYARALPATVYDPYIEQVARDNGVDPSLVKAVALVESGFNAKAVSSKGARGLMQLMPATAKQYGVSDIHDPYQNLRAGAAHLRGLLDEFDGNVTLALAAYNAGSGAVRRYGGVPAYAETRDYVKKIEGKLGRTSRSSPRTTLAVASTKIQMQVEADGSITLSN